MMAIRALKPAVEVKGLEEVEESDWVREDGSESVDVSEDEVGCEAVEVDGETGGICETVVVDVSTAED